MNDDLQRIEGRINEVYDRVSEIKAEMVVLKWKVGTISAFIGAAFASAVAFVLRKFGV